MSTVKPPVHSIKRVEDHLQVMRLKEPRFTARYYIQSPGELQDVKFEKETPANPDKYYKNALASVKRFLALQ